MSDAEDSAEAHSFLRVKTPQTGGGIGEYNHHSFAGCLLYKERDATPRAQPHH